MSHPTFNHDSWPMSIMRWYTPAAVTLFFFLCTSTISPNAILAEPIQSGHIRGVQLPKKTGFVLSRHKNNARRHRRLELEDDPCQQTYSNDHEGGTTRGISTCIETAMSNGCDKARVMPDDGTPIVLNTTNAPLLGQQCNSTYNGKGYWFEITGKGRNVILSTCHDETLIPTVISVYSSSEGGCGMQRSCSEFKTTTTDDCFPLRFFADDDVTYKISVMGDIENTPVAELEDQIIAFSITREVICPCWSASELLSTTPVTNQYLAQSCNTIINTDDNLGNVNSTTGSIFILDAFDEGAQISRIGINQSSIRCSLQGALISRSIQEKILDDEVEVCLALLHDRCAELSFEGAVWSMFQEACSLEDFVDTILHSDEGDLDVEEYVDCLKVGTNVPTALPSHKPGMDHQHHQP